MDDYFDITQVDCRPRSTRMCGVPLISCGSRDSAVQPSGTIIISRPDYREQNEMHATLDGIRPRPRFWTWPPQNDNTAAQGAVSIRHDLAALAILSDVRDAPFNHRWVKRDFQRRDEFSHFLHAELWGWHPRWG